MRRFSLTSHPVVAALAVWAVLMLGILWQSIAHAEAGAALRDPEADRLYQQLMAYPGDQEKTLAYANRASQLGDYEAAVAPLERLLIVNPTSSKLRLELGILYYLLGSKEVSKTYLQEAKTGATANPDIIKQADSYLSRM